MDATYVMPSDAENMIEDGVSYRSFVTMEGARHFCETEHSAFAWGSSRDGREFYVFFDTKAFALHLDHLAERITL